MAELIVPPSLRDAHRRGLARYLANGSGPILGTLIELTAKGRDLRQELFNLRLQQASAQLEKPARLRLLRRDIARIETRISELRRKAA